MVILFQPTFLKCKQSIIKHYILMFIVGFTFCVFNLQMETLKQLKLRFFSLIKISFVGMQLCVPTGVFCQTNLVVNPDIEIYDTCPDNTGQISRANDWWQYSGATSNYFNTCSSNWTVTIPSYWGYQMPHSGNGYLNAGTLRVEKPRNFMIFFGDSLGYNQAREPIAGTFTQPLRPVPHKIEFYVSTVVNDNNMVFTNAFDLLLMKEKEDVFRPVSPYIDLNRVIPIYTGDTVIKDTMHWMKLSVCFLPRGGDRYFAIGAFRDTSKIKLEFAGENFINSYSASYYFDSFKVYECDTCCIGAFEYADAVTLVNNPSSNTNPAQFTVVLHGQTTATLTLYDSAGRLVKKIAFSDMYTQYTLDEILAQGMYHYAFESSNGTKDYGKLLVVE